MSNQPLNVPVRPIINKKSKPTESMFRLFLTRIERSETLYELSGAKELAKLS
jgi:hypothetical protein